MPQWWEKKLETYQKIKDHLHSAKGAADPRMSLEAVVRVNNLEVIKNHLQTNGDPFSQLVNVNALKGLLLVGWEVSPRSRGF